MIEKEQIQYPANSKKIIISEDLGGNYIPAKEFPEKLTYMPEVGEASEKLSIMPSVGEPPYKLSFAEDLGGLTRPGESKPEVIPFVFSPEQIASLMLQLAHYGEGEQEI